MSCGNPSDVVDREAETNRFENLLSFTTERRVLAITADSGWGKSALLTKLRHLCEFQHGIPVALIPFEEFEDRPDELELVIDVAEQLGQAGVPFLLFNKLLRARSNHEVSIFAEGLEGAVNASEALVHRSQVAATIFNIKRADNVHADNVASPAWSPVAERQSKQLCLDIFLAELIKVANQRSMVIIFDAVERAPQKLMRWLFLTLLSSGLLAAVGKDCKLLIVLAGQNLEARLKPLFKNYDTCFESISILELWNGLEVTVRFFEVHGLSGLRPHQVEFLHRCLLDREVSLTAALAMANYLQGGGTARR